MEGIDWGLAIEVYLDTTMVREAKGSVHRRKKDQEDIET